MYCGMYRVCIQKCILSVLCTYDTYQYGAYVLVCIVVCIGMYRARMMSWYPPIHTHTGINTSTNTLRIHANTGTNAYEYVTTTLRAPLGAGYIACDSPYNLAPPPRGPGGAARARRHRAGPAMPHAPGGAARQELRRCNSVVVGALRPRQRLEALACLHCLGSPLVDEGSSWKSPATKNKLSAAKQQSKPHASINRTVSFPQAL